MCLPMTLAGEVGGMVAPRVIGTGAVILKAVSLFSGAGGLDLGLELAGIRLALAVDVDRWALETVARNWRRVFGRDVPVVRARVEDLTWQDIARAAGLRPGDDVVLAGAPPCEPFSTAGRRMGLADRRGRGMLEFARLVSEGRPRFFVLEQVPGVLSAAKAHMPYYDRVRMPPRDVPPECRPGSLFPELWSQLQATGYRLWRHVLNAADYGVPQVRRRLIVVGSRDWEEIDFPPPPTHSDRPLDGLPPWRTLQEALAGLCDPCPEYLPLPRSWGHLMSLVPPGGCWRDLPEHLWQDALGGAFGGPEKGGRRGFLRRLSWDRPAPTLTDRPNHRSGTLCHPEEDRPLSVREYARIQGFPDDWEFCGGLATRYRLIGQATPVGLARAVGEAIVKAACIAEVPAEVAR